MAEKDVPILELRSLARDFTSGGVVRPQVTRALGGIDLRVMPGESIGIVGESGSGKSTLARCALHLLRPTAGHVFFDGVDLDGVGDRDLRRMRREFQIIFQDVLASLDPRMTIRRLLAEPFEVHRLGDRRQRDAAIRDLLHSVSLDQSLLDRYPDELSGGQQQRVVLARALALKPRLLVADEPVASLDPSVQAQVLNLLADLRQRLGLTLLLISHSLPVVRHLCDRIAVLYRGRFVEEAPAGSFFERPRHPYSQLLLSCVSGATPPPPAASVEEDAITPAEPGCAFRPRCPQAMPLCGAAEPGLAEHGRENKVACFLHSNAVRPE